MFGEQREDGETANGKRRLFLRYYVFNLKDVHGETIFIFERRKPTPNPEFL